MKYPFIQRSKGLCENAPEMMWMTTMNPDTRRLMPPHWEHLKTVDSAQALTAELAAFWK